MPKTNKIVITAALFLAFMLFFLKGKAAPKKARSMSSYLDILKMAIPAHEGFSSVPYWDFKQWSWGYGSRVPGSDPINIGKAAALKKYGKVTEAEALAQMMQYIDTFWAQIRPKIKILLNEQQKAALIQFTYALGPGNAFNLIKYININDPNLKSHWLSYNKVAGKVNKYTQLLRQKEWDMWNS